MWLQLLGNWKIECLLICSFVYILQKNDINNVNEEIY